MPILKALVREQIATLKTLFPLMANKRRPLLIQERGNSREANFNIAQNFGDIFRIKLIVGGHANTL